MTKHTRRHWWDYLYPRSLRAAMVTLAILSMGMFAFAATMGQHILSYWFVAFAAALMFMLAAYWDRID